MEIRPLEIETRRDRSGPGSVDDLFDRLFDDDVTGKGRIRCPRCGWQPGSGDLWSCECGTFWNTFDTGGRCPGCARQWTETQCLSCHAWSPHREWYGEKD